MPDLLQWIAVMFLVLGALVALVGLIAFKRRRPMAALGRLLAAIVFIALGAAAGAVALGVRGYRALTYEEVAATASTRPAGPKRFQVQFRFPDGREASYLLSGDELYVDAHILKWRPFVGVFGLHTAYELDRVAGRYVDLAEERAQPHTVYSLARERAVDLFSLRQRYALLSPLLDAEYGSATFVAADAPMQYELRVSATGLLIRRLEPAS